MNDAITYIVIPLLFSLLAMGLLWFLVFDPLQKRSEKQYQDYLQNIKNEKSLVNKMNCKQLADSLLYDQLNYTDNQRLASNHYIGKCLK